MTTNKQRSPNYPMWSLSEAVELVEKLYKTEKRGVFPPESVTAAWGYKSYSGGVRTRFSSLKRYGLIEQKKGLEAKLSERALTLSLRNPASREYIAALQEAALEPPLFREYYEQGRLQSSDDTLKHDLIVNRNFTDNGADDFLGAFRASMAFANLTNDDTVSRQNEDEISQPKEENDAMPPAPNPDVPDRVVSLPLAANKWVNLRGPFPMTESDEWTLMQAVLDAMKPGLVIADSQKPTARPELYRDDNPDVGQPDNA